MSWIKKPLLARRGHQPSRPRNTRPALEALEERWVPTVTYHGGNVLPNVEVQALYYGQDWVTNSSLYAQTGKLEGALNDLVQSKYLDGLTRAGYGVGRGSFTRGWIASGEQPNGGVTDDDIRIQIEQRVLSGDLAGPDANRLYVVFVEPNILVQSGNQDSTQFFGYHGAFADAGGTVFRYAVIAYPGGPNISTPGLDAFNDMMVTASHEVAEAVTDPDVGFARLGWYDDAANAEVGEAAGDNSAAFHGYTVQLIADQNDQPIPLPNLQVTATTFTAVSGKSTSVRLATATDSSGLTDFTKLTAYIGWGDGTYSYGSVGLDRDGNFPVYGTHTYADAGAYKVTLYIQDTTDHYSRAFASDGKANVKAGYTQLPGRDKLNILQLVDFSTTGSQTAGAKYIEADPSGIDQPSFDIIQPPAAIPPLVVVNVPPGPPPQFVVDAAAFVPDAGSTTQILAIDTASAGASVQTDLTQASYQPIYQALTSFDPMLTASVIPDAANATEILAIDTVSPGTSVQSDLTKASYQPIDHALTSFSPVLTDTAFNSPFLSPGAFTIK